MTYFHYYASTIRNIADVGKYAIYPAAYAAGLMAVKDRGISMDQKKTYAANCARITTAAVYTAISSTFHAMESDMIDANSREAVSAELGIDPEKVKFSDYGKSENSLVKNAYHQSLSLQKYRYGTDLLFLLPVIISKVAPTLPKSVSGPGLNEYDFLPFAGKAAYWAGETFAVEKSANYEIVKLRENLESTGKDISANDLLAVYQRSRTDRKLPMIHTKEELDAIHPIMEKMAKEYNKREGFSLSEIVYLIGMDKIKIHGPDGKKVSHETVEQSMHEVDKVLAIGLDGIRAENKIINEKSGRIANGESQKPTDFVGRFANSAFNGSQKIMSSITGRKRGYKAEEYISVRDPGEIVNLNFDINR